MTVNKNDIKKYLQIGCRILTAEGFGYTVKSIKFDHVVTNQISEYHRIVKFNRITEIVSYKIPTDIENRSYAGHFLKIKNPQKKYPDYWKENEWAQITGLNNLNYKIDIRYLNSNLNTAISINEIAEYNPFSYSSIKFEEQKFGVTEEWLTGSVNNSVPGTLISGIVIPPQHMKVMENYFVTKHENKTKLDFANLLNSQKIVLDQYN